MIAFACPRCQTRIDRHDSEALTRIACPGCGQRVQVPPAPEAEAQTVMGELLPVPIASTTPRPLAKQAAKIIRCVCMHCQAVIKAPAKAAGTRASCPRCGLKVDIPAPRTTTFEDDPPAILGQGPMALAVPPPVAASGPPVALPVVAHQRWYIYGSGPDQLGFTFGPFDLAQMQRFAAEGRLSPNDQVCKEGTENWLPAITISGLNMPLPQANAPFQQNLKVGAATSQLDPGPNSRQEAPVVVNVINNNGPLTQPEQWNSAPDSATSRQKTGNAIGKPFFVMLAIVAAIMLWWNWTDIKPHLQESAPGVFKKSSRDLIVARWRSQESDPKKRETIIFYADGRVDIVHPKENVVDPPYQLTYKFIDDHTLEVSLLPGQRPEAINRSVRMQISFPSENELVTTWLDGTPVKLHRVP